MLVIATAPFRCVVITTVTPLALLVAVTDATSGVSLEGVVQVPIGFGGNFATIRAPAVTQTGGWATPTVTATVTSWWPHGVASGLGFEDRSGGVEAHELRTTAAISTANTG